MGMTDYTTRYDNIVTVSEEEAIKPSEMRGLTVYEAFCQSSDSLANKKWSIYNAMCHNRCVEGNYAEMVGPENNIDSMIVRSVIERADTVRVYAV